MKSKEGDLRLHNFDFNCEFDNADYFAIAKFFSPMYFDFMANNDEQSIENLIKEIRKYIGKKKFKLETAYNFFYSILYKEYKNEYIYKNIVCDTILKKNHANSHVIIPEFRVGFSKADLAVFNGTSTVYEIKSDKDTTNRLESQIKDYLMFFDNIYIVTNKTLIQKVLSIIPSSVGVMLLDDDNEIYIEKESISNLDNIKHDIIFDSLRKNEYLNIIKAEFGVIPELPNTKIYKYCLDLFRTIPIKDAHRYVIDELLKRKIKNAQLELIYTLPESMKSISLTKRYNIEKCNNILNFIERVY
ncbi:TPA: sce7726 family protein [Elizabethkingia anophelis]|uniref:sce7726 family protein n=1 Tax=Elizabethkingia anophelis TaxID=1117645 RepID=UPI00040B6494|nr:sce7726 family protein [Elizabethkingia anophelis]MCT3743876.1 sce7726 family protein [Elizabethkingia anophelis]MDC8024683.1 sce7726 family protein [Elizabethkingia anophelis]MDV3492289.1 hypothetical protein [Elizabethkingia anophelis]HAT3991949.1 sce7726 family protein [Elizabethkingia anophelis]HAT3995695.1 sce7726 family protein [Elizabethkingia anophelis]